LLEGTTPDPISYGHLDRLVLNGGWCIGKEEERNVAGLPRPPEDDGRSSAKTCRGSWKEEKKVEETYHQKYERNQ
jgi:hypothetical protein